MSPASAFRDPEAIPVSKLPEPLRDRAKSWRAAAGGWARVGGDWGAVQGQDAGPGGPAAGRADNGAAGAVDAGDSGDVRVCAGGGRGMKNTMNGWVSVKDSLPRATEPVLISCTEGVWVARYLAEPYDLGDIWGKEDGYANEIGPGWFTWQGRFPEVDPEEGVTHWMSLPAAPGTFAWAMEDM